MLPNAGLFFYWVCRIIGVRGTVPLTTIGTKADRRTTPDTSAKLTEEPSFRYVGKADKRTVPLTEDTEKVSKEPSP